MMFTVENLQNLLTLVTLISVPVGVFYYVMTLRNTRKNQELQLETRQAQLFQSIYSRFQDEKLIEIELEVMSYEFKDMDDFNARYGMDGWVKALVVGRYMEGLGVHASRNLIDVAMIDDLMSSVIINFWEKFEPIVVEMRKETPQYGEYTEYLYRQVKKISEQQHPEIKT